MKTEEVFFAVASNNLEELKIYLRDKDINVINEKKQTLLHIAIMYGHTDIFNYLIENKIKINEKDYKGYTPAMLAINNNQIGYLKILMRLNCDLLLKDNRDEDVLFKAFDLDRAAIIDLLLEKMHIDFDDINSNDENIMFSIVRSQNIELYKKYANIKYIDVRDYYDNTLLHHAVRYNNIQMAKALLEDGIYINSRNNNDETPLFMAVKSDLVDMARFLISKGAIIEVENNFCEYLMDIAVGKQVYDLLNELSMTESYKNYIRVFPLHYAIIMKDYDEIQRRINLANINRKDTLGYTPMELAVILRDNKAIKLLKK